MADNAAINNLTKAIHGHNHRMDLLIERLDRIATALEGSDDATARQAGSST